MNDCRTCIYDPDSYNDSGCYGCVQYSNYKPKPKQTNADCIRAMSDEELAVFLAKVDATVYRADLDVIAYRGGKVNENFDWLKQEVSE